MFYVAAWAYVREPFFYLRIFNRNADEIFVSITPLSGPSVENAILPLLERQTPASHIYGTNHMPIAELVSRKSKRKVGTVF